MKTKALQRRIRFKAPPIGLSVLMATFALNILALALPLVMLQIFDRVIPFQSTETLLFLFWGLCSVVLFEFVLRAARSVLLGDMGRSLENELSAQFMKATLRADPEAFANTTPAAHLEQFGAISQLRGYYAGQGRILAIDLPFTVIFVGMIWVIGGSLVLVPIVCIGLLLLFKSALQSAQSSIFEKRRVLDGRRYSFLAEALSQIKTLKANTMEAQILRRYELLQAQTTDISRKIITFSGLAQSFGALFSQFAVAAMGLFGSYLVITNQIGIAELAACMLLNGRTVQPMLKALGLWVQSENIAAARAKFEDVCNIEERANPSDLPTELRGEVVFDALALKNGDGEKYLFRGAYTRLDAGACLLISGSANTGTSECLKLFLGDREPSEGQLLIDGRPAADFALMRGPGGIGYVDHSPVIFAGTVLENISAFGDGDAIEYALELSVKLGIEKYVHRLPLGYNTQVQSSPALLNNRTAIQGLSLVRALALKPKLLLLNDVGAGMDGAARSALKNYIHSQKGETTFVIVETSDCFDALADRTVTLSDTHEELLQAWENDAAVDQARAPISQSHIAPEAA